MERRNGVTIWIKNRLRTKEPATAGIKIRLASLLRAIGHPNAELSVLFIGDYAMRSLNRRYRNKDKTTDVLSFSLREGKFKDIRPELLGDIVISVPAARRQARQAGHELRHEIDCLLVHGLVHLLGYDHGRSGADARLMAGKERLLLKKLS